MKRQALGALFYALAALIPSIPASAAPCAGFTDVDTEDPAKAPFCSSVEWMKNRGITLGCAATLYCPDDYVTRLQMAAFMSRLGTYLPPTLVDSTGKALGGSLFTWGSNPPAVLMRFQGRVFKLELSQNPSQYTPSGQQLFEYVSEQLFFQLANCSFDGEVFIARRDSYFPDAAVVVFGTEPSTPGPRQLYFSVPGSPASGVAYSSIYVNGSCVNINGASSPLMAAIKQGLDVTTLWTPPFSFQ